MTEQWHPLAYDMAVRNLSQRRLAKKAGISPSYLSLLLRGKRRMSVRMERRLARLIRKSPPIIGPRA